MKFFVIASAIATAAVANIAAHDQSPLKTDTKSVVVAVSAYVESYQKAFASLVADETYTQIVYTPWSKGAATREIRGEMFLAYVPADRAWIAVHDVAEVDGAAIPERGAVRELLAAGSWQSVAARVSDLNARYNIGSIARNINEPTFALKIFDPQRIKGFKFDRVAVETPASGPPLVTLQFIERDRPTIVKAPLGAPIFSRGEIVVEAGTGRILKTLMRFDSGPITADQRTTYAPDERLGLLVPVSYTETYIDHQGGARKETTICEARYTNYRRFAATGRIKK